MGLRTYQAKRDFDQTPEPAGRVRSSGRRRFVVQEHHASQLHFDFRLEMGGVLKSWALPKGPSLNPRDRRLAVQVEDHPVDYINFKGHIAEGNYGAGDVYIWDRGTYEVVGVDDPLQALAAGRLKLRLKGDQLRGEFNLLQMQGRPGQWLLIKAKDDQADPGWRLEQVHHAGGQGPPAAKRARRARSRKAAPPSKTTKAAKSRGATPAASPVPAARAFARRALSGDARVKSGTHVVELTSLDRTYWPDDGYTKADLLRYEWQVSKYTLPYLADRPLILKRYPAGLQGGSFFQHDVNDVPSFVRTVRLEAETGRPIDYVVGNNRATLLYLANLGAIAHNPWHSRVGHLDCPDWMVFDLDPGEAVPFASICDLALAVKDVLDRLGLEACAKTSGSRGLHVYVPLRAIHPYDQVAPFAERVAAAVVAENLSLATLERSLKTRPAGTIYLDHLQNARGKTVAAPYSVRARPGATVSAPLTWREVSRHVDPRDYTIKTMPRRLGRVGDLFRPVLDEAQGLERARLRLARLEAAQA